jgi:hypothetical protein
MRDQSIVREKDNKQCLSSRDGLRAALGRLLWRGTILFGEQWALRVIREVAGDIDNFIFFSIYFLVCAIPPFLLLCFLRVGIRET